MEYKRNAVSLISQYGNIWGMRSLVVGDMRMLGVI